MQLSCVTKSKKWRKEMGTMLNEEKKWYEKAGKESDLAPLVAKRPAQP